MATYGTFVDGVSLKASEVNDFFQWTTFAGVIKQLGSVSSSQNRCRYARVNKLIHASFNFPLNGTGTAGNRVEVDLPIAAASTSARTIGFGSIFDTSTSTRYDVVPLLNSTTTVVFLTTSATSLTSYFGLTNGPAITLAVDDSVTFSIVYEAA